MTTARELIKRALRKINAYDREGEPTAAEMSDSLEELNSLLGMWLAKSLTVLTTSQESFSLVSGTGSYSIGSGQTFDTTRPVKVNNAFVRSGDTDYQLDIVSDEVYREIDLKSTGGLPYLLNYHATFPYGTINVYYVPSANYTIYLDLVKQLSDISDLDETFNLPKEYSDPIVYNLAVRLAPEFGALLPQYVADLAIDSLSQLKSLNMSKNMREARLGVGLMTTQDWDFGDEQ